MRLGALWRHRGRVGYLIFRSLGVLHHLIVGELRTKNNCLIKNDCGTLPIPPTTYTLTHGQSKLVAFGMAQNQWRAIVKCLRIYLADADEKI